MRGPHNIVRLIRTGATFERTGAMQVVLDAFEAPKPLRILARTLGWPRRKGGGGTAASCSRMRRREVPAAHTRVDAPVLLRVEGQEHPVAPALALGAGVRHPVGSDCPRAGDVRV